MTSRSDMSDVAPLPLLADRDLSAPLAWRAGRPVSGYRYLLDVQRLAQQLPQQGPVLNLCSDRYAFAVGLGAALSRGHASLLPPDARADTLARLATPGGSTYVLTDDAQLNAPGLHCHLVDLHQEDASESSSEVVGAVPGIAAGAHAVSLLTSGSTGVPQAHAKRWETLVGDVAAAAPRLSALFGRESLAGLTLVATVPVQHSYGLESSALLAMLAGAAFDSSRPFFPADIVAALEAVPRPRALVTTPFHLKTLLLSGIELPQVDFMLSATAPLSPQLAAQAEQALGGPLIEIYGSTETGQIATRHTTGSEVWEMLGDIRVRREDAPGDDGEAAERYIVEGDFVPAPTPMADVLELIDDQRFRLLGRANDLIHVAGRRSSLGHLNYHLNSIPGVQDGAFWIPDEVTDGVVRPVAFVVAPELSSESIISALRERLETVFVPRRVLRVQALPREATGKLTVRTLREFALAQLAGEGETVRLTREVPADHPAFAGHFPGQPLLPGAFILAEVMEALAQVPALAARLGERPSLAAAKFLAPVGPGAQLTISMVPESGPSRGVRFEVHRGDVLAASGRWTAGSESDK
ncbi:AMP-binding protein [Variovorax dokdonensis]|uniref:Long-chain-fatty-acid--CoA ligase n=1 Tax=Variovorax dokdonensis TaxID=344883 RepID=A0ABT7NCA5_9BURK|nr:AMP-binding protein [Variovorax dokdonensis]MDM0045574.1 AMP-binding protein [Variovorax dokdonensis]